MRQDLLWYYFLTFIIALFITYFITPIAKKIAVYYKVVDLPGERKVHEHPTPRWGGIAIYIGFFLSVGSCLIISNKFSELFPLRHDKHLIGIIIAGTLMFIMGLIDDKKDLPAKWKLLIQIIAALLLFFIFDLKIDYITNPFGHLFNPSSAVDLIISLLWIVGITNALNLLDGLDGLLAGVSAISAMLFFVIALLYKQYFSALLLAALAGSTLGFLRFNFHPASIFMGDTGSQFLGIMWACISILGGLKVPTMTVMIPILILGIPIVDTFTSMLRRFMKGRPIFEPDKEHLHHQLIKLGLTQKQAVWLLYAMTLLMGVLALLLSPPR